MLSLGHDDLRHIGWLSIKGNLTWPSERGTGASALPAAELVGPDGTVLGVDLAEKLLEQARAKAAQRHLQNVEFRLADMTDLEKTRTALFAGAL